MIYLLYTLHVLVCVFLILVVLLQQGKGADLSVFGGGSTQTAFGARGATTLLHKITVVSFIVFVVTTLMIGIPQFSGNSSVMRDGSAARKPGTSPLRRTPGPGAKPVPAPAQTRIPVGPAGTPPPAAGGQPAAPTAPTSPTAPTATRPPAGAPTPAAKAPPAKPVPPPSQAPKPGAPGTPR